MSSIIKDSLYRALSLRYEHTILDCVARLHIYFNNPVGIGEHAQITNEMDKLIESMTNAEDKLKSLRFHFGGKENG